MDFLGKLASTADGNKQQQHPPQQQSSGSNDLLGKLGSFAGGSSGHSQQQQPQQPSGSGGFFDKLHGMAGGGPESEKKEDALDKGTSPSAKCLA